MRLRLAEGLEKSGRLDREVHPHLSPGQFLGFLHLQDPDDLAVHGQGARRFVHGDLPGETAVDRVVFEQVGEILDVAQIVHRHDLQFRMRERLAQKKAAYPAETVYSYTGHILIIKHKTQTTKAQTGENIGIICSFPVWN